MSQQVFYFPLAFYPVLLYDIGRIERYGRTDPNSGCAIRGNMNKGFPIDNSAILYLALLRKNHSNIYRVSAVMKEPVCPDTLQAAADRVYKRFPTVIAGFRPGFFQYTLVPARTPPQVRPDPGCLITMSRKEVHECAYRVFYSGRQISIEAFHALTDGYGAIASFTTLLAEYLRLKHGIHIPVEYALVDPEQAPCAQELTDEYLLRHNGRPRRLPSRYAYQLPSDSQRCWNVLTSVRSYDTRQIIDAAHHYGVSVTSLLGGVMAKSIMELQRRHTSPGQEKPVRIMVPVDLRKLFKSKTLRNFILYALPTLEPGGSRQSFEDWLKDFQGQMRTHTDRKRMASIMAYNVKAQLSWLFRMVPRSIKCTAMRVAYRYFGESNSSITLTNLGNVKLPSEMERCIEDIQVILTPRAQSPYNCAIISYGNKLTVNISRFRKEPELENLFFHQLDNALKY